MMGEVASSTLFFGMSKKATHPVFQEIFKKVGQDEARHLAICLTILEKDWPGLTEEYKTLITRQLRAGFVFLSMILWEPPNQFWEIPDYFLPNHRVLVEHARQGGLGVLTYDEQADNWRLGARARAGDGRAVGHRLPGDSGTRSRRRRRRRHRTRGHHPRLLVCTVAARMRAPHV